MSIIEHSNFTTVEFPGAVAGSTAPAIDYPLTAGEASLLATGGRVTVVVEIAAADLADDAASHLHRLACAFGIPTGPAWTVLGQAGAGTYMVEYSTGLDSEF